MSRRGWEIFGLYKILRDVGVRRLWAMLAFATFASGALATVALLGASGSVQRKEIYVSSKNWVEAKHLKNVEFVYFSPNPKCDFDLQKIAQTIAKLSEAAAVVHSIPKGRILLAITFACGLKRSTLYRREVSFEMWISYCDPVAGPACLAQTVLGFVQPLHLDDWSCAMEIVRQELLNKAPRDVIRILRTNC